MMIYLDHNATTRPETPVVEAMLDVWGRLHANAASPHSLGRSAGRSVERAREQVADLAGVPPARVVFTSGSTESMNTALRAAADTGADRLVVPQTEHKAALDPVVLLEREGVEVQWLEVSPKGAVSVAAVEEAIPEDGEATLVVMAANNETGVLNDVRSLGDRVRDRGGVVVCDATQQLGKLPVDLTLWGVDYAAASAHKMYGPQGVGALIVPTGAEAVPLIRGGGHEKGWRSGTLNVAGIVGFGEAARIARERLDEDIEEQTARRERFETMLAQRVAGVTVIAKDVPRLPNTSSVRIAGVDADALIANCPDLAIASGSACTSAVPSPSHVLLAMGLPPEEAEEVIRVSGGRHTTDAEVDEAVDMIEAAVTRIRALI